MNNGDGGTPLGCDSPRSGVGLRGRSRAISAGVSTWVPFLCSSVTHDKQYILKSGFTRQSSVGDLMQQLNRRLAPREIIVATMSKSITSDIVPGN